MKRQPTNKIIFSENQLSEIINLYINENNSAAQIAKIYRVSESKIFSTLHKENVKLRYKTKKYKLDENIFDKIDNKSKAYFLGVICADGGIQTETTLAINLQEPDVDVLQYLRSLLKTEKPLYFSDIKKKHKDWQNMYTLSIVSKNIINSLKRMGISYRKSLTLKFPSISNEFNKSLILGYFDGDGSLGYNKKTKDYLISICGTNCFLKTMKEHIEKNVKIKGHIYKHSNIKKLCISGNRQVYKFLTWLYNDEPFKMNRKYIKYLKLKKYINRNLIET